MNTLDALRTGHNVPRREGKNDPLPEDAPSGGGVGFRAKP